MSDSWQRRAFPVPWFYAVIRMDPLTMVKDLGLDDEETLEAVKQFSPKKYLVYVNFALDLPMPTSKWCRYCVKPIGNTLRVEDRRNGMLPDMVIPIFPNTQCSSETRPPICPASDFPFTNCFHWLDTITNVRMRRPASGFVDDCRAIRLEPKQHHATIETFVQDYPRMNEVMLEEGDDDSTEEDLPDAVPTWALHDPVVQRACCSFDPAEYRRPGEARDPAAAPITPPGPDSSTSRPSICALASNLPVYIAEDERYGYGEDEDEKGTVADIFAVNIFGWDPDPTFPLVPLVDFWFELDEHLTQDSIPSPVEWYEEERKIILIIMDAFARKEHALRQRPLIEGHPKTEKTESAGPHSAFDSRTLQSDELLDSVSVKTGSDQCILEDCHETLCVKGHRAQ